MSVNGCNPIFYPCFRNFWEGLGEGPGSKVECVRADIVGDVGRTQEVLEVQEQGFVARVNKRGFGAEDALEDDVGWHIFTKRVPR